MHRARWNFRSAKNQLEQGTHAKHEEFWVNYHRATAHAINSLQRLYLLVTESNAIASILRTAPTRYSDRMTESIQALLTTTVDLDQLKKELYFVRRMMGHRTKNPEYFKAGVEHLRVMATVRQVETTSLVRDKALPLHLKTSDGQQWARSLTNRHQYSNWREYSRGLEAIMNANPPRWTIEPLRNSTRIMLFQLHRTLIRLGEYTYANRTLKNSTLFRMIRRSHHTILDSSARIYELLDEMVALRYHRLHCFTDVSLGKEVELGRRLWQQILVEAPSGSTEGQTNSKIRRVNRNIPLVLMKKNVSASSLLASKGRVPVTNGRGFFRWGRWTGQDWNTEAIQLYLEDMSVQAAAHAQANYDAIQLRVSRTGPRALDVFLMAHYKSQWMANERMHAFTRFRVDLAVIEFLLRTAPLRISQYLASQITELSILNYAMSRELDSLRKLRTTIACLPHNPLLFQSLITRYKAERKVDSLSASVFLHLKSQRARIKAANGFMPNYSQFESSWRGVRKERKQIAKLSSTLHSWRDQFPTKVIVPFQSTVTLIAMRQQRLHQELRTIYKRGGPFKGRTRAHGVQVMNDADQDAARMIHLGEDLAAIRCYKMHRFPNSISESILALDRASFQRTNSTFPFDLEKKDIAKWEQKQQRKRLLKLRQRERERLWKLRKQKERKGVERGEELARKNTQEQVMALSADAMTPTKKHIMPQTIAPNRKQTGHTPRRNRIRLNRAKAREALAAQTRLD
jgi:hypothetical protein